MLLAFIRAHRGSVEHPLQSSHIAVVCRVMVDDSGKHPVRKSAPDAADAIFKAMFSQASSQLFISPHCTIERHVDGLPSCPTVTPE